MSNKIQQIKTLVKIYPQVYSYILIDQKDFEGSQKIGYTGLESVDKRINQQVNGTIKLKHKKLWSGPAYFEHGKDFLDTTFHEFLEKKGYERRINLGKEWFYFNGEQEKSKELFDLFRKKGFAALQNVNGKLEYKLRDEQEEAVIKALEYFGKTEKGEFLWNAKPRFGKTLASYDLAKQLKANKALIVTNRPAIANAWFDDYEMFIDGYAFISETSSLNNRGTITREQHISDKPIKPLLTFLSLQDLKGSKYFGGNFDKLKWIADLEWDLLIIDEAHEGIDTGRTDAAFDMIKRKHTLHLSGTPFKALANEKFPKEAIYNWTYIDEQRVKKIELDQIKDNEVESGEHTDLPDLKLFTYRISQMITNEVNEGIVIENENFDYAFDLNEFFRTDKKEFVHKNDIKEFLKNLTTNKKYPFSTPELREELKHTFWYVGNRVDSVKALEKLLKEDNVFKDYEIIIAAGNGQTFEEEENDIRGNETSYQKVKNAIRENEKTITLSCGQLTTGVTIKEWTAVLMLTDIKSPSLYMQAAFRAQNPYKVLRNGELYMKNSAYLFDFAPTRVLEIYDKFANGLNPKAVKGEITEKERKENIQDLLNFFPVISEDVNGEMVELDAEKVLTFPNALAASEIVNARFMTNLLFNESIKGVFSFPKEVEDILNKLPEEKNKRTLKSNETIDLDDARKVSENKIVKINENTEIILGEKIFKTNTERVVDNLLENNSEQISSEELVLNFSQVSEPLIAKYKEVYKATQAETNEATKQIQEKVKLVAAEFNSSEIKDSATLKQKLIAILEDDFVKNKVAEKEDAAVAKVQKTKEDEIRDRLRSFTRTIPMFIMANSSKGEITIDNFDLEITDKDFLELTSITKEEFYKLRDGFDYEESGVRKTFQGVFNKYRFNASIAEFKLKKDQLANYFTAEQDIFELIPNQKTNQIFTPKKVVQMMINQLEEHDPSLFTRTDSNFIDLYMKSGMYITEIVKKLFTNSRKNYNSDDECLKHILENQVYGLAPTPILQGITQSYIFGFDIENKISRSNFIQHDITPEAKGGIAKQKLQQLLNNKENMKFDAVVGNPPYQDSKDGGKDLPIYQYFYETSESLSDVYCLISPARFLFDAGATNSDWNKKMLNSEHIKVLQFTRKSNEVFPNTDIKGGVAVLLRDANKELGPIGFFTSFNELDSILKKVNINSQENISDLIYGVTSYTFTRKLYEDFPDSVNRVGEGSGNQMTSSIFEAIPEIFSNSKKSDHDIQIYGRKNNERVFQWVNREYINLPANFEKYKVFLPAANGSGEIGEALSTPILGDTFIGHTATFISIGEFETEQEAKNCLKYLKSKFCRTMLGIKKTTQHNKTKKVWECVPNQDFTQNSDVDWSKSITEIDQHLYAKYGFSQEEIAFIDGKVQSMS
jgi:superfamily II DNA or RNA helicase